MTVPVMSLSLMPVTSAIRAASVRERGRGVGRRRINTEGIVILLLPVSPENEGSLGRAKFRVLRTNIV